MRVTPHISDDSKSLQESTEDEQDTEDEPLLESSGSHSCLEELSDVVNDRLNPNSNECPIVVSNEQHFATFDKQQQQEENTHIDPSLENCECCKNDKRSIRNVTCTETDSALEKIVKALKSWSTKIFEPPPDVFERIKPNVMLYGCVTPEDHYATIKRAVQISIEMEGLKGLKECGFHYESTACEEHIGMTNSDAVFKCPNCCGNRLYHTASGTLITRKNRQQFIADGEMYDACTSLCQEYAQELMQREGNLNWVSVCEEEEKGNPIRVLVDKDYPLLGNHSVQKNRNDNLNKSHQNNDITKPTLLIITGKGKVRAGIFSRQHLLVSSIESSTALPMIQDAKKRDMRVAILDPNARGEYNGISTFEKSMRTLFGKQDEGSDSDNPRHGPLYILSHSASGAQLARYLQTEGQHLLRYIKSIAFTDSTHSIQWLVDHHEIASFFQGPASLYIRSSNEYRDNDWQNHRPGDIAVTDQHWQHRFGQIQTVWAGTTDHSLTNWYSHSCIWDHFDRCSDDRKNDQPTDNASKTV